MLFTAGVYSLVSWEVSRRLGLEFYGVGLCIFCNYGWRLGWLLGPDGRPGRRVLRDFIPILWHACTMSSAASINCHKAEHPLFDNLASVISSRDFMIAS